MASPSSVRRALTLALLALPGALAAHTAEWATREALDPFDGIALTIASTSSEYLDSRLQVECRDDGASRRLRVRIVPTGGAGAAIDPDAVGELLVQVDERPMRSFDAGALSVASDEGGGTVVGDRSQAQTRVRALVEELAAGNRAWAKLRASGRDRLFSYDLEGARAAIRAPLEACAAASATDGVRADARVTLSAAELSAGSAALPDGLDMRGLVDRLDGALDRASEALERVAGGDDPRDALPDVREAADALEEFHSVFRRLPDAAASPLSRIAAARADRLRDLADAALGAPGAGATLAPAVGSLLDTLGRIEG